MGTAAGVDGAFAVTNGRSYDSQQRWGVRRLRRSQRVIRAVS
jgi:hypothetical protein